MTRPAIRSVAAWTLVALGIVALGAHQGTMSRMDAWAWLALIALALSPLVGLPGRPGLRWLLASIPFWIFGNAVEGLLLVAVGLSITAMVFVGLAPTLVGRGVNRPERQRLAHLASGPLLAITPQVFFGGQRNRLPTFLANGAFVGAAMLAIAAAFSSDAELFVALSFAAVIIGTTFAFGNWFATRVRLRVDHVGVHGRTLIVEHTAKWSDITGLALRYVILPGHGVRLVYYVVESPDTEISFPSSIVGAQDLRNIVEAATGLKWPEPEMTATM